MLFKLLDFLKMLLPFRILVWIYRNKKALPAVIKTKSGKLLKVVMINTRYGLLYTDTDYTKNRLKVLRQYQDELNAKSKQITEELNSMSIEARELFMNGEL